MYTGFTAPIAGGEERNDWKKVEKDASGWVSTQERRTLHCKSWEMATDVRTTLSGLGGRGEGVEGGH
jgi:hypothetical protein